MAKILRFKRGSSSATEAPAAPPKVVFRPGRQPLIVRSDARPSNFSSDAVPADGMPRPGAPDPGLDRRRRLFRHGALFVAAVLLLIVTGAAFFGEHGYLAIRRSQKEYVALAAKVEESRTRVRTLNAEVTKLQTDPHAIERIAREQLGFAGKGEVTFLLSGQEEEDEDLAVTPAPKGAEKPAEPEPEKP